MAIKNVPTNIKTYYESFIDKKKQKLSQCEKEHSEAVKQLNEKYEYLVTIADEIEKSFKVHLNEYREFKDKKYYDGILLKLTKGLYINRSNDYLLVNDLFELHSFAIIEKKVYDLEQQIEFLKRLTNISKTEYRNILKTFYEEVHKKMILEGAGYAYTGHLGWICINRCKLVNPRKRVDYKATREREAQLKAEGKRIYNKEEAEWCAANGIEYKAEDKRVYLNNEYCYQVPLIQCHLTNATRLKLETTDYRARNYRGMTNDDLYELCNGNTKSICNLSVDLKTKLHLCVKADTILYTKFIRNENQEPFASSKAYSKNRQ